jgi:hypothetical protein
MTDDNHQSPLNANDNATLEAEIEAMARAGASAAKIAEVLKERGISGWSRPTVSRFLRDKLGARRARKSSGLIPAADEYVHADSETGLPPADVYAEDPATLPAPPGLPGAPGELPVVVPADATLAQIDWWLDLAKKHVAEAEKAGNMAAVAAFMARAAAFTEARRKATPEPPPDPNANPDMVRMGEQVEAQLFRLVDALLEELEQ